VSARLLVVQHQDDCPPAWFGEWFAAAGVGYDVLLAHREAVPATLDDHDALVVLGGEMGANDDADFGWLGPTKKLIASVVAARRPFLGICLGHQLAAVALGGEVQRNPGGQALGLTPLGLTEVGRTDELLGAIPSGSLAVQWNSDIVTRLPADATVLATSPDGTVQAACFGRRAWGVQIHPEVSPDTFRGWIEAEAAAGKPPAARTLEAQVAIAAAEEQLRQSWRPLATRFAAVVVGCAAP
jgi:GMP synthase (glutamine-hydrolysing)